MEWLLMKHGIVTARGLYTRSRYEECLKLTARLLEVDPLDEQVNLLFMQSSLELRGLNSTLSALETLDLKYIEQQSVLPPLLHNFRLMLKQIPPN